MRVAIHLNAEVERELAGLGILDTDIVIADGLDQSRSEVAVDLVAPTLGLQRRNTIGDEALPALRCVAAAIDEDHAASGGEALGDPHLAEALFAKRPPVRPPQRPGRDEQNSAPRHRQTGSGGETGAHRLPA